MKKILLFINFILISLVSNAQTFVSPIGFIDDESNRQKVLEYIRKDVKEKYSKIGMDDATTLRMMEKENLKAFKELTKASDTNLLKKVIDKYCEIGMCDYSTIFMMYKEEKKANNSTTEWDN